MTTLRETFIETLRDTYDAEHQIMNALPGFIHLVKNDHLRKTIETHLAKTLQHAQRLEQVFAIVGAKAEGHKCHGVAGMLMEGQEATEGDDSEVAVILALQKVEHYEIAAYDALVSWAKLLAQAQSNQSPYACGALVSWAKLLEKQKASLILEETLIEEKEANEKLTDIIREIVNFDEESQFESRRAA
ncbi:MAG: ferritin-like domain-containing protein [Limisphaerales bacterium]